VFEAAAQREALVRGTPATRDRTAMPAVGVDEAQARDIAPTSTSDRKPMKPMNALEVLKEDHDYVKKSYRAFQKLDPEEDLEEVQAIVKNVCAALKVHARIEEEILYPAARRALKDADLVDEAEVEHDSAKTLIRRIERLKPKDPKYAAAFIVLCEYVDHHVKEEENEMFPKLRRARLNLGALGKKLMQRKARLAARSG
jgi:hemerythrin-like domain-containing protein